MGLFEHFPYTNFHSLNIEWAIEKIKELLQQGETLYTTLQQWKTDTDTELTAWKNQTLADLTSWEERLTADLEEWKQGVDIDFASYERQLSAMVDQAEQYKISAGVSADNASSSAEAAAQAAVAGTAALANEAPVFDATKAYSAGAYVLYDSVLYRFTADHAAGAWTGTDAAAVNIGGEVSGLRDAFNLSVGVRQIDFTRGEYINTNSQNIGAEVDLTPVRNVSLAYAIVPCVEGESLILNARGYTSGRLWAFLDAENRLISRSAQSVTASNLVVPVPKNAAKCVINTYISSIGCCVVGNNPSVETPKLYAKIDNDFEGKLGILNDSIFELGSINITNNGWTYQAATDRVRLKQDVILHVKIGDVIGLTSYSGYSWYLGLLDDDDGMYYKAGWLNGDWTSTHNGRCVIMIRTDPSAEIDDYRTLARLFKGYPAISYVQDNYVDKSEELLLDHDYLVKSINHRGYRDEAPENTIPAFKLSRKKGFQYVETDIAFTSDNVPVLLHDPTINRTARNADGTAIETSIPIASITYEQALQYVFCGNHYGRYPTVRIPTLAEFMVLCRNIGICPYLELKHEVGTTSQIQSCVEIVKEAGMLNHTTWISFDATMLEIVKNYSPTSRLGRLVQTPPITQSNITGVQALRTGTNDVFIIGGNYTSQEVEMCKNADLPLEAGVTGLTDIPNLPAYVHGIMTEGAIAGQILLSKNINL